MRLSEGVLTETTGKKETVPIFMFDANGKYVVKTMGEVSSHVPSAWFEKGFGLVLTELSVAAAYVVWT